MEKYVKEINGTRVCKSRYEIVISKGDRNIYNPTEEMLLEDGWTLYIPENDSPIMSEEDQLTMEFNYIKEKILEYDSSEIINKFYINDIPVWFDKNTRVGLNVRFNAELCSGQIDTTLWCNDYEITLPVEIAIDMLHEIEIYASKCYDNTQKHIKNIKSLMIIEELHDYNYKTGYPEYMHFRF